ncbi:MAG: hypothetical protein LBH56_02715 [Coriobacteriales bacterium]|jgi:hypothetical protein|nr:hypothetical protein [Coriobacteriales bacterium]
MKTGEQDLNNAVQDAAEETITDERAQAADPGQDAESPIDPGQDAVALDVVGEGELNSEEILERTVLYALEQAAEALSQAGSFEPFTILIDGEELFIEEQPGNSEEDSYASARRAIYQMERICNAYVFCYDGYVDLEDGASDAVVAEFANKGDEKAQVVVMMYHLHGDHYHFDETLYQVGEADTLFSNETAAKTEEEYRDTDAPSPAPTSPASPEA